MANKIESKSDDIPIVFATDENYAIPLLVAITSLMENADNTTNYHIYILIDDEFPKEIQNKISNIEKIYNNSVIEFVIVEQQFSDSVINNHITKAGCYRLLLLTLLPNIEKCIYLDCDIIVLKDLFSLFNTNIEDYYVAGVKDSYVISDLGENHANKINLPNINEYINSGVLIFNLQQLRKNNLQEKFLDLINQNNTIFVDQDIINLCCYGKIKHIDLKYNLPTVQYKLGKNTRIVNYQLTNTFDIEEISSAIGESTILHYLSKVKPWQDKNCNCADVWWKYHNLALSNAGQTDNK